MFIVCRSLNSLVALQRAIVLGRSIVLDHVSVFLRHPFMNVKVQSLGSTIFNLYLKMISLLFLEHSLIE